MMTVSQTIFKLKLEASHGEAVSLLDFKGQYIVLYFYPKDDTSGCTQEGIDFRDHYAAFKKLNAVIIGVSKDSVKSHQKFCDKYEFPFLLLADTEKKLCEAFDVMKEKSLYGRKYMGIERSTFLIDPKGKVCHEWRKVNVKGHVTEVLDILKELS